MSWPVQDLLDAFLAMARSDVLTPALAVYDGEVPDAPEPAYALVYFYIETPDGLTAPDAVSLTMASAPIDAWVYVHCVGGDPQAARAARAVSGRVRSAVLDKTLTVTGRTCFPIRHDHSQSPRRSEELGPTVMDQVDIYRWRSVPA